MCDVCGRSAAMTHDGACCECVTWFATFGGSYAFFP